ncbi:MAG: PQQ-binding-like beta-propeller repeat protein [Elusimicrobia bacterium]|nr:PQQ-binding-like beta-propeller repeat protein [Elusimicrobiota bacterium]
MTAALLSLLSQLAWAAAGPANSPWPQLRNNPQHTSSNTFTGPARPRLRYYNLVEGGFGSSNGLAIDGNGAIYVVSGSSVVSLSATGVKRWEVPHGGQSDVQPAVTSNGQVLVTTRTALGTRYAVSLSTADGSLLWGGSTTRICNDLGEMPGAGSALLANDGNHYYMHSDYPGASGSNSCITSFTSDGASNWEVVGVGGSQGTGTGSLSPDGTKLYQADTGGNVEALNPATQIDAWSAAAVNAELLGVTLDGTVVVVRATGNGALRGYNQDGTVRWNQNLDYLNTSLPPTISGNQIFVTTSNSAANTINGSIVSLDGTTGNVLWSVDLSTILPGGRNIHSCGIMCASSFAPLTVAGNLVIASFQGLRVGTGTFQGIAAFETSNGSHRWSLLLPVDEGRGQIVPTAANLFQFDGQRLRIYDDSAASTFTVTVSSQVLVPGGNVTVTASVRDSFNNPVSSVSVAFHVLSGLASPTGSVALTDANGLATVRYSSASADSTVAKSTFTVAVRCLDFQEFRSDIFIQGEALDHFTVEVPTSTPIGVPFEMKVYARNEYGSGLPSFPGSAGPVTVNLSPFLSGTQVAGSGSLGVTSVGISNGTGTVANQTYNKIESIQIKAAQTSPGTKVGTSTTVVVTGPDNFLITMPTGSVAGQNFSVTITAVQGSTQVFGYSATLSLTPVVWNSTGQAATGQLSVTNVNMPASGQVTISNQSHNFGEGIRIKATDSNLGVSGVSSSMTVTAPALTINHYAVSVPSQVTVGRPFSMDIVARDASSAPVTYSLARSLSIQSVLSGTNISGSGSLGDDNVELPIGSTQVTVSAQSYNKIETIQLRVSDESGRVGISSPIAFIGPSSFEITVPTATTAGSSFQIIVVARDGSNEQVLGYNGTVNLAAVNASAITVAGGGVLGVTSLNLASGLGVSAFQTYTKAEGIKLRASDSAINVTSYSSSMTIQPGPPASLTLAANPQSTIAGVPSVLTATALDAFSNVLQGSTVTFTVLSGSGTVAASASALSAASSSTAAVSNASGQAQAFFSSTNTASSQANVIRASLSALTADTTVYNSILIGSSGGTIAHFGDSKIRAVIPGNAYGFNIRLSIQKSGEIPAAEVAQATAAMARNPETFVSTFTAKFTAVRDSDPNSSVGSASRLVTLELPFDIDASSRVTVGSIGPSSLLVPYSVLRVFKLNSARSVFEMVLDGTNLPDLSNRSMQVQVSDPNGIYALGVPSYATVGAGSSTTVRATLASGATVSVSVPAGAFAASVTLEVSVANSASLPAVTGSMKGTGLGVSISAGGFQPALPVTISMGYAASDIPGLNPDHLRLARYDSGAGWVILDSRVDTAARTVTGATNHFSLFQIMAVSPQAGVDIGFAYPNPFRPSQGHSNINFGDLAAGARVRIYSVSGRLLRELEADATGRVLNWNATDSEGRRLPSGVYLAVFRSGKDKRTVKFAVQR